MWTLRLKNLQNSTKSRISQFAILLHRGSRKIYLLPHFSCYLRNFLPRCWKWLFPLKLVSDKKKKIRAPRGADFSGLLRKRSHPKILKFDQFLARYMSKSALAPIFGRIRFGPQLGHFKSDLDKQKTNVSTYRDESIGEMN